MLFPSFSSFKNKNVLLLCHKGADLDSFVSAAAIKSVYPDFNFSIGVPDHINFETKSLAAKLNISFIFNPKISDFDAVILLDFNSYDMAGSVASELKTFFSVNPNSVFVVDHHVPKLSSVVSKKENMLFDEFAFSCAEILFKHFVDSKYSISSSVAVLLAIGVYVDSNAFTVASKNTFSAFADLLELGKISFYNLLELIDLETSASEKVAFLKSAQRVRIFVLDDFVVSTSVVGAFEAGSAFALIKIGADVAFVGSSDGSSYRISGRASTIFVQKYGFDLAKHIFAPLSNMTNGFGGGHSGAASFSGDGSVDIALNQCVILFSNFLNSYFNKKFKIREY